MYRPPHQQNHPTDTRNIVIASIVAMLILFLWQTFYMKPLQEEQKAWHEAQQQKEAAIEKEVVARKERGEPAPLPFVQPREAVLQQGKVARERVKINAPSLHGTVNLMGGRLDDLTLAGFHQALDKQSPEVILFSPAQSANRYFAETGWLAAAGVAVPDATTLWQQVSQGNLTPDNPLVMRWQNDAGLAFVRKIAVDKDFLFTIEDQVRNLGGEAKNLAPFARIQRARDDKQAFYISHEGAVGVLGDRLVEHTYDDLKEDGDESYEQVRGWFGIGDKYWLAAFVPASEGDEAALMDVNMRHIEADNPRYQVDGKQKTLTIAPGQTVSVTTHLYAGAKRVQLLDRYEDQLNIPLFDRAVDFGWLYFLTRPIFEVLTIFNSWLGNFGLAILMLTVVIKLMLFPLANKSFRSMAKMKELMPEITEIRERYKGDAMQTNQKMMELYKRKKVNPASGCLPILLQIPIFFALYKVLFVSIEMRHAPFYGWVHDLSAPDPTTIFNLFGLLPYDLPLWIPVIGAWPILFVISMYLQQFLSPPPADPVQKMVIRWMPAIFLFLFAGFPAGLVIYWTWSNSLSVLQQWVITRQIKKEMHG